MSQADEVDRSGDWRSAPRWLIGVLIASQMVNMLVVGLAAGRMWVHRGSHGWHDHRRGEGLRSFVASLPEARQATLKPYLDGSETAVKAARANVRAMRGKVRALLAAEPFDKAAFAAALGEATAARQALRARMSSDFAELVGALLPGERKALAERSQRRHGRHRDDEGR